MRAVEESLSLAVATAKTGLTYTWAEHEYEAHQIVMDLEQLAGEIEPLLRAAAVMNRMEPARPRPR
jgi:hypothetical protein